ncbi:MAG: response regulator, partial [Armatimonadetes bacterium]|nr:response regulator [Armatimonadota bacterium]
MRANILVVDDEAGPRESLRMILNVEHDVRLAASGPEALEIIQEDPPDLVFLDIRMPTMDGTEVLRRIKEMAPDVEVAMITAYGAVSSAQRAMRLGALDYITKPFGVAEVKSVVNRALAKRKEQQEQRQLMLELSNTIAHLSDQLSDERVQKSRNEGQALLEGLTSVHSSIEDQLNEVLRLSSIGEVAAEVAHDLNNFLSTILFRIEIMLLDVDQNQTVDAANLVDGLRQIALAARDGGEALERLSLLAKSNPYEPNGEADLNEILQEAAELSQGRVDNPERHSISYELSELPVIEGSPAGLRTVFTNLIINAHHAMEGEGRITLRSFMQDDMVCAQVIDSGVGMTPDVL